MHPCDSPRLRRLTITLRLTPAFVLAFALLAPARAQPAGSEAKEGSKAEAPRAISLKGPVAWRVYQRKADDRADIPIELSDGAPADAIRDVLITGLGLSPGTATYRDGKLLNVPTGGPYQIQVGLGLKPGQALEGQSNTLTVGPVFVGDLWILAGQSNMQGVGNLADVTPPSDRVALLGMNGQWGRAEEPLHWLVDSPDPVHHGNPADRSARSEAEHRSRAKGSGLGLPFAVVLSAATNVPIGLIACAHGGTSMEQWDPARKGDGGRSLYGSMLRQLDLAGNKVRGVLWYQGESDASGPASEKFAQRFTDLIAAVRSDLGQPELPFYYVQIGRFVNPAAPSPKGWNAVQDAQRQIADQVPNTAVVAAIDLELDDLIHVGTQGLKRLGTRLARIALRDLFGQTGATTPTLDRVSKRSDNALVVKFKGVNLATTPADSPQPQAGLPGLTGSFRLNEPAVVATAAGSLRGLQPARHIAGFSIRKEDGTELPLIYDAAVGQAKDTVILKLTGAIPEGASLWYGYGLDPFCNLTDALDMAVPVFGPVALDGKK